MAHALQRLVQERVGVAAFRCVHENSVMSLMKNLIQEHKLKQKHPRDAPAARSDGRVQKNGFGKLVGGGGEWVGKCAMRDKCAPFRAHSHSASNLYYGTRDPSFL